MGRRLLARCSTRRRIAPRMHAGKLFYCAFTSGLESGCGAEGNRHQGLRAWQAGLHRGGHARQDCGAELLGARVEAFFGGESIGRQSFWACCFAWRRAGKLVPAIPRSQRRRAYSCWPLLAARAVLASAACQRATEHSSVQGRRAGGLRVPQVAVVMLMLGDGSSLCNWAIGTFGGSIGRARSRSRRRPRPHCLRSVRAARCAPPFQPPRRHHHGALLPAARCPPWRSHACTTVCCMPCHGPPHTRPPALLPAQTMAEDRGRGGFGRGFGDRGRGDRGRGDRGRGDRGRGRGRGRKDEEEKWVPCTKLGRLVQQVRWGHGGGRMHAWRWQAHAGCMRACRHAWAHAATRAARCCRLPCMRGAWLRGWRRRGPASASPRPTTSPTSRRPARAGQD